MKNAGFEAAKVVLHGNPSREAGRRNQEVMICEDSNIVNRSIKPFCRERRQKRGGGAVRCEADLAQKSDAQALDDIIGREPTPQLAAEMAEQCQRLLELLRDADLRSIALWKMEGYTNDEIACKLDCARSTVQRKLNLIQSRWEQEVA
jgi:DNA-directed RNA polymerase specialized sigma24 family protein